MLNRFSHFGQVEFPVKKSLTACNPLYRNSFLMFMRCAVFLLVLFYRKIVVGREIQSASSVIGLAFLILCLSPFSSAQEVKTESPQLRPCWQFATAGLSAVKPVVQAEKIFLPLADGSLLALNTSNGETLWRTELGGEITGQIAANGNYVFIVSQIAAAENKKNALVIRALSNSTGVTAWQGELPQASRISLALRDNVLLAAVSDGGSERKIIALSANNGELLWTQKLSANASSPLIINGNTFYFATEDNVMRVHSVVDGKEVRQFRLPHQANGTLTLAEGILLISDAAGRVSALREANGKRLWKMQLGGAVQNILPTQNRVLFSSLDDFVYFHRLNSGGRIWRKRLSSRPLGAIQIDNETIVLTAIGEDSGTVINLDKGKSVSQIPFGAEKNAVSAPLSSGQFVLVPTTNGIVTFAPNTAQCPAK